MTKVNVESMLEYFSKFVMENGGKKMKKMWEEEEKENVEKMMKKMVAKAKKSVKPKVVKDPEAPKKKSAWLLFCDEERKVIKKEIADGKTEKIAPKKMFAELGRRYKLVEEEKKAELDEAAKVSKEEYAEKMKTYVPKEGTKVEKKKKAKKDKNAPKGAKSAWIFFCADERKKLAKKKLNAKEVMAELSARWAKIKDTKKADKYKEMAKKDKVRYEEEMVDYTPAEEEEESESEKEESAEEEESDAESEKTDESEDDEEEEKKPRRRNRKINIDQH